MSEIDDAVGELEERHKRTYMCFDCEAGPFDSVQALTAHRRKEHGYRAGADGNGNGRARGTARTEGPARVNVSEEEERLVESLAQLGMFAAPIAPYTGLTIISRAPDREIPVPNAKPIKKRGTASVIMDYAKRDPRIMRAVIRFNNLMHGGDLFELAASHAAAIAVDVHAVEPHMRLPIPGVPEEAQPEPIMLLIGDVVMDVESRMAEAQQHMAQEAVEAGAEA